MEYSARRAAIVVDLTIDSDPEDVISRQARTSSSSIDLTHNSDEEESVARRATNNANSIDLTYESDPEEIAGRGTTKNDPFDLTGVDSSSSGSSSPFIEQHHSIGTDDCSGTFLPRLPFPISQLGRPAPGFYYGSSSSKKAHTDGNLIAPAIDKDEEEYEEGEAGNNNQGDDVGWWPPNEDRDRNDSNFDAMASSPPLPSCQYHSHNEHLEDIVIETNEDRQMVSSIDRTTPAQDDGSADIARLNEDDVEQDDVSGMNLDHDPRRPSFSPLTNVPSSPFSENQTVSSHTPSAALSSDDAILKYKLIPQVDGPIEGTTSKPAPLSALDSLGPDAFENLSKVLFQIAAELDGSSSESSSGEESDFNIKGKRRKKGKAAASKAWSEKRTKGSTNSKQWPGRLSK